MNRVRFFHFGHFWRTTDDEESKIPSSHSLLKDNRLWTEKESFIAVTFEGQQMMNRVLFLHIGHFWRTTNDEQRKIPSFRSHSKDNNDEPRKIPSFRSLLKDNKWWTEKDSFILVIFEGQKMMNWVIFLHFGHFWRTINDEERKIPSFRSLLKDNKWWTE